LGYTCDTNCLGFANGFFGGPFGTTALSAEASPFNGTSNFIANMAVLNSVQVEGTISLPPGDVAGVDGMTFVVIGLDTVNNGLAAVSESYTVASGQSSVDYVLDLPNVGNAMWIVQYFCENNCAVENSQRGFYGGPGATRAFSGGAQRLSVTSTVTGIDMTVLGTQSINGTVQLLNGRVAPAGGVELEVGAFDVNGGSGNAGTETIVTIAAGSSSVNYQFDVPADSVSEWRVRYFCTVGCMDSLIVGYYGGATTTADINAAALLAGTVSHSNIDLLVLDEDAEFNDDDDGDSVLNNVDNCRFVPNMDQNDSNSNGVGDLCDTAIEDLCFPIVVSSNRIAVVCL
jgi:hypothetical protein